MIQKNELFCKLGLFVCDKLALLNKLLILESLIVQNDTIIEYNRQNDV